MSTSANKQCRRHTDVVEYICMNRVAISIDNTKTTKRGATGELILPCKLGAYYSTKKPAITFTMATAALPIMLKMPPKPAVNINVMECLSTSRKPLIAAVQKFSPVKAT